MDEEILRELKIMNNKMTRITYLLTATCLYIETDAWDSIKAEFNRNIGKLTWMIDSDEKAFITKLDEDEEV